MSARYHVGPGFEIIDAHSTGGILDIDEVCDRLNGQESLNSALRDAVEELQKAITGAIDAARGDV